MAHRLAALGIIIAALALGFAAPRDAYGAERQVAFDAAGRITRIDETLARRIGMFVDRYDGFREARLFMTTSSVGDTASPSAADSSFVLEITMLRGGQSLREREVLTSEQARVLRADVESRAATAKPVPDKLDQEGRPRMLLGSAVLGLGFYGWAVPYLLDINDGSQASGLYLLTSGASFFLPMMLTSQSPVSLSAANLYWYGSTRGIVHGLLLYDALQDSNGDGQAAVATALVASLTEGALGYAYARSGGIDDGTTQSMATGGDYGLLWGYSVANLVNTGTEAYGQGTAGMMLATSLVGVAGGRALAAHRAYSRGDALVMRSGGFAGLLAASAIADAASADGEGRRIFAAGFLAGSLTGLLVGDRLVAGREFTAGEGMLVQIGTAAGGLMGLGVVAVVNPQGDASAAYTASAAVGAVLGYAMTYSGLSRKAVARSSEGTSWRFELAPEGMMAALGLGPERGTSHRAAPAPALARVTIGF